MFHKKLVSNFKEEIMNQFILLGIFSSTIKDNILFGKEYNHKLFERVVHATALDTVC
jgi:hypothetical protein